MKRVGTVVLAVAMLTPTVAQAQSRPSNTMHTNSAALYLDKAKKTRVEEEKQDNLQKALEFALQGISARSNNPRAYLLAGQTYVQLGDAIAADSMFDKAEELWPDYKKETAVEREAAWVKAYNSGVLAMQANKMDEAIGHFEAATAVFDGRPLAAVSLAQLYQQKGDAAKSVEAYRKALSILQTAPRDKLSPEDQQQWRTWEQEIPVRIASQLTAAGKPDEAIALYRDVLAKDPKNLFAKGNLAALLQQSGQNEEASKLMTELLAEDLTDGEAFAIGVSLFRANNQEQAAAAFRKSLEKNAYNRDAYFNLGQALLAIARANPNEKAPELLPVYKEIVDVTTKLHDIDPSNRQILQLRAFGYRGMSEAAPAAEAETYKKQTLETLQALEALTLDVSNVTMTPGNPTEIAGSIINIKGTAGQSVTIRFSFLDANGQPVAPDKDVTVNLGASEAPVPFNITVESDKVAGWKYTIVN